MVKMLYWLCKEAECGPNKMQIKHVVLRNFNGYDRFDPWKVFEESQFTHFLSVPDKNDVREEWREKFCDAFKDDKSAHEALKKTFLEKKEISEESLFDFYDQFSRGEFLDEEIQKCFKDEFENYLQQKFDLKVLQ